MKCCVATGKFRVRVSSCSQLSVNQSDMTLRSRNTSGESAFLSSDERTSCTYTSQRQTALNKGKLPVENVTREMKNRGKPVKKKQYMRKKRQRAFKNTIVLAPFHALKQCFQNKLKDLYKKGLLESNAKRVKIPNNSLFQYDVMEMRTNQSDGEGHESKKVDAASKKRKSDQSDQSEYCNCFRKVDEQKRPAVNPELPSTSSAAPSPVKAVGPPQAKKLRTQTPAEIIRKDEEKKCASQSRGESNKGRLSKEDAVRRGKTQSKKTIDKRPKKRNNFKYNTRSSTRKETVQGDDNAEDGKEAKQTDSQNGKTTNEPKDRKKVDDTLQEDASHRDSRGTTLISMRSNSSVIFLEEITCPKVEGDAKPERAAEESIAAISAVTQMFDTLLKSPGDDVLKKFRSGSKKMNRRSCSSERRPEEDDSGYGQREIEANVVVQEPNLETSSSEDSRTIDSSGMPQSSGGKAFPHRPDKPAAYIFGPKCPFQEIRESCEFGFGMSRTFSDDEVDDYQSGGNVDFKKHR